MPENIGRRNMMKSSLRYALALPFLNFEDEIKEEFSFFDNTLSSYSMTLAYPKELLIETAEQMGITTEGKSRLEITREIFSRQEVDNEGN